MRVHDSQAYRKMDVTRDRISRDYGKVKTKRINQIISIAKMCISIYKKTKSFLPLSIIFENQLRDQYV